MPLEREPRITGIRRLFRLPRSARRLDDDIDAEIEFHIGSRIGDLRSRGLSDDEARAVARREYGDLAASRRELREVERRRLRRERWAARWDDLWRDGRFALRSFRRQPVYTIGVALVLALGIGANASMFGIVDHLLLSAPPHVSDPARVMSVSYVRTFEGRQDYQDVGSYPMYLDLRELRRLFAGVAAYTPTDLVTGAGRSAQPLRGMSVTAGYFSTLGVRPALGRFFLPEENGDPVAPNVAVISYGLWQRMFGGRAAIVGAELQLGTARFTIVGVAPRHFTGVTSQAVDVWVPLTAGVSPQEVAAWSKSRNGFWLWLVVRLAPGVAAPSAAEEATEVLRANMVRDGQPTTFIAQRQPSFALRSVLPRAAHADDPDAKVALLLAAVSLLVLLLSCANVANLQLARGLRRRRELAMRVALGAGAARLVSQLLVESVLLGLSGGLMGLGVAWLGGEAAHRWVFSSQDWEDTPPVDLHVLAYAALVALLAGVATGLLPAIRARRANLVDALKQGAREGQVHRSPARVGLLVSQAMLSLLMLAGAGLFVRSMLRIRALPLGMEPSRVVVGQLNLAGQRFTAAEGTALYDRLLRDVERYPGVEEAALTTSLPFWSSYGTRVTVPGRDSLPRVRDGGPYFSGVTPGYLQAMGMRLLRGRNLTASDESTSHYVIIVNASFAQLAWPGADPIGRCVKLGGDTMPCSEVVGVVANARRQEVIEDVSLQLFVPITQVPEPTGARTLVIRTTARPEALIEPIRRRVQLLEPTMPYVNLYPMENLVSPQRRSWRVGAIVFTAFGALALALAMIGLYSVLSYDVGQRTQELGVRAALGASPDQLARSVVGAGVRVVVLGIALGIAVSLLVGHLVQPLLFETSFHDPFILVGASGILVIVATLASVLPARRALAVDPIVALRSD